MNSDIYEYITQTHPGTRWHNPAGGEASAAKANTTTIVVDVDAILSSAARDFGTGTPFDTDTSPVTFERLARRVSDLIIRLARTRPHVSSIFITCRMLWNTPLLRRAAIKDTRPYYSSNRSALGFSPLPARASPDDAASLPIGGLLSRHRPAPADMLRDPKVRPFVMSVVFDAVFTILRRENYSVVDITGGRELSIVVMHPLFSTHTDEDHQASGTANIVHLGANLRENVLVFSPDGPREAHSNGGLYIGEAALQAAWVLDTLYGGESPHRDHDGGVEMHIDADLALPVCLFARHGMEMHHIAAGKYLTLWTSDRGIFDIAKLYTALSRDDPVSAIVSLLSRPYRIEAAAKYRAPSIFPAEVTINVAELFRELYAEDDADSPPPTIPRQVMDSMVAPDGQMRRYGVAGEAPEETAAAAAWEDAVSAAWAVAYAAAGHRPMFSGGQPWIAASPPHEPDIDHAGVMDFDLDRDPQLASALATGSTDLRTQQGLPPVLIVRRLFREQNTPLLMSSRGDACIFKCRLYWGNPETSGDRADAHTDGIFAETGLAIRQIFPIFNEGTLERISKSPNRAALLSAFDLVAPLKNVEIHSMRALSGVQGQDWRVLLIQTLKHNSVEGPDGAAVFPDPHICFVYAETSIITAADNYSADIGADGNVGLKLRNGASEPSRMIMLPPAAIVEHETWSIFVRVSSFVPAPDEDPVSITEIPTWLDVLGRDVVKDTKINPAAVATVDGTYAAVVGPEEDRRGSAAKMYAWKAQKMAATLPRATFADAGLALDRAGAPEQLPARAVKVEYDLEDPWRGEIETRAFLGTLSASHRVADYAMPLLRADAGESWPSVSRNVALAGPAMEAAYLGMLEWKMWYSAHKRAGKFPETENRVRIDRVSRAATTGPVYRTWLFAHVSEEDDDDHLLRKIEGFMGKKHLRLLNSVLPLTTDMMASVSRRTGDITVYFIGWDEADVRAYIYYAHVENESMIKRLGGDIRFVMAT